MRAVGWGTAAAAAAAAAAVAHTQERLFMRPSAVSKKKTKKKKKSHKTFAQCVTQLTVQLSPFIGTRAAAPLESVVNKPKT